MRFFKRNKVNNVADNNEKIQSTALKMLTTYGEHYFQWEGRLYESDIVRACIRPKVKAVGKLIAKHIRGDKQETQVNPEVSIEFLLKEPNPFMTGQKLQEKVVTQLCLNNNAFILVVKDENNRPIQLYPIPCVMCETVYINNQLHLKFHYKNGQQHLFAYSDIIHLRNDYNESDIFGDSPAKAISQMMEVVSMIDQGIVKAIKNSGIIRWLLKYSTALKDEDLKKNVKNFVDNYLNIESDTFGAAGIDSKADVERIENKDYVPNALQTKETVNRIYSFFNTNEKIVQSRWSEEEWNAYFEAEIAPVAIELGDTYTRRIFTRKDRVLKNRIVFDANNLQCASLNSKLNLVQMVDRGAMLINEWREAMNLAPIEGGDKPIRRLDTEVVNIVESLIARISDNNTEQIGSVIKDILNATEADERSETIEKAC